MKEKLTEKEQRAGEMLLTMLNNRKRPTPREANWILRATKLLKPAQSLVRKLGI